MKRVLEDELNIDLSNVRPDELFSVLIKLDHVTIKNMQKSNKGLKEFIIKRNVWMIIFQRDYPLAYQMFEKNINEFTIKINAISKTRDSDIWKRYYELMVLPLERYNLQTNQTRQFEGSAEIYLPNSIDRKVICYIVTESERIYIVISKNDMGQLLPHKTLGKPADLGNRVTGNFKSINGFSRYQLVLIMGEFRLVEYTIREPELVSNKEFTVFYLASLAEANSASCSQWEHSS